MTVAGGASGAEIMSTLAGVGDLVWWWCDAIAGTAIVAAGVGYGIYKLFGGKDK